MNISKAILVWIFHRIQATAFSISALWGFSSLLHYEAKIVDWILIPLLVTSVYQWNRITDYGEDRHNYPEDADAAMKSEKIIVIIAVVFALTSIFLSLLSSTLISNLLVFSLITLGFIYSTPIIGPNKKKRLKDFFIIKDSAPAIGWATCVVLYPSINATSNPNLFELIMCYISVFTGSFILEIICDIRDYNGDNKQGIKSLPVQLGMLKTKAIINILNIFSAIVILLLVFSGIISYPWLLFVVNNILVYILVNYMFEKLKGNRLISHILIFFQIILTIILGFIS